MNSQPESHFHKLEVLRRPTWHLRGLGKFDSCWLKPWSGFSHCGQRLYETLPHSAEPGTVWDYNEFHNQEGLRRDLYRIT